MNIEIRTYHGSGNWVTARETKPYFDGDILVLCESSWRTNGGRAEINSYVIVNDDDLVSVLVGYRYSGKYAGGSQYWQHYKNRCRVHWKVLSELDRMRILDCDTPSWAKIPGKLVRDYIKPHELEKLEYDNAGGLIGYKWLEVRDDGLHSLYGRSDLWQDSMLIADRVPSDENTNGIYAMKSKKSPVLYYYRSRGRALVQLILSGVVIEGSQGMRAEQANIIAVLEVL